MRPITSLAVGAVLLPVGLVIGLAWVPAAAADRTAYDASTACATPNPAARTCWTEAPATVEKTEVVARLRGNSDWRVSVTDEFGDQTVNVAHRGVFNRLAAREGIAARFWGGHLVLLRIAGDEDLPTDDEPGRQLVIAIMCGFFVLLAGAIFFLGGIGLHRHQGSWMRTASRAEWDENIFDAVAPPWRRWFEFGFSVVFFTLASTAIAWGWFDIPPVPVALVTVGLAGLAYAWLLHYRARQVMEGKPFRAKRR
ncbi:MAG TPA: hypothetical protein VM674_03305 [Candidatus Acidoferrum sp.]|nr:hypothetical protein [Candidatus Acidoferrum sp.]